jgi:hypothetical protein
MQDPFEITFTTLDGELANQIVRSLDAERDADPHVFSRRSIDGAAATWIVSAVLTSQSISILLGYILKWKALQNIESIKVRSTPDGEVSFEIENPRPEHVDSLLDRFQGKPAISSDDQNRD